MSESELSEAVSRLSAWLRDYGPQKNQSFVNDVRVLVELGKRHIDGRSMEFLCTDINGQPFDYSNVAINYKVSEDGTSANDWSSAPRR